ncbi:hypothetical protein BDZ97DRAFT_1838491, partial [Flammula alnicola]
MGSSDPKNSADAESNNIVKTEVRNNIAQSGVLQPPSDSTSRSITSNGGLSLAVPTSLTSEPTMVLSPTSSTTSPVAVYNYCTGYCRQQPINNGNVVPDADVVCLSAAKDSQRSWEDEEGHSMTQYLVKSLSTCSHQAFRLRR